MKKHHYLFVVAGITILTLALFYSIQGTSPPNTTTTTTFSTTTTTTSSTSTTTETFNVIAKDWEWDVTDSNGNILVNQIKVKSGDTVILKIKSVDVNHGFFLPDFNINKQLSPGEEITVQFVADKTGTFGFACSVFCGEGHSTMRGNLVVS